MSPRLERPEPPYVQIAEHYRQLIRDGILAEGDRLPAVAAIAEEWGVAPRTAHKALRYLRGAQLVDISPQGTRVRQQRETPAPRDRVRRELHGERLDVERVQVREVGVVTRAYVAELLGLDEGAEVIRREEVTYRGETPIRLSVRWLPGRFTADVPELTRPEAVNTVEAVQRATGRKVHRGEDAIEARSANEREASALQLPVGSPILAGVWQWSDTAGVIEYGEYVCPPKHVVTYRYEVEEVT